MGAQDATLVIATGERIHEDRDMTMALNSVPSLDQILECHARIREHIHRTPVLTSAYLNELSGAGLFFKCENFQKVGAFKSRGACNAVFSLTAAEANRGVVTHSSGNHGQALARAAARRGIPATIVMPRNSAAPKLAAVRGYGSEVVLCEPTLEAREESTRRVIEQTGATLIHPYDDLRIITGQATAALELLQDVPGLDVVIAPVGGGGLLSGTALSTAYLAPEAAVFGAEPANADDAFRSLREGHIVPSIRPQTIADGLLTSLGQRTFPIIAKHVKAILLADEEAIIRAMRWVWERMKIVIEPSAAVAVACALDHRDRFAGKRVGIILSGGNVDLDRLPWLR